MNKATISKENNINFSKTTGQKISFGLYSIFQFWKLFLKNLFSSFEGLFFGVALPLFLVAIIYLLFKGEPGIKDHQVLLIQGLVLLPAANFGISYLPQQLVSWKRSVFFKRLDASPVSKTFFMVTLVAFYTMVILIAIFVIMLWTWIILALSNGLNGVDGANTAFNKINFGWFVLGALLMSAICLSIGLFIAGLVSQEGTAQAYAFITFLPMAFISGIMLPPFLLDQADALRIITYFLPTKYPVFVNAIAWNGGPTGFPPVLKYSLEFPSIWIPIGGSLGWMVTFITLSRFTFKYSSNK